jgi:hypothetical protein
MQVLIAPSFGEDDLRGREKQSVVFRVLPMQPSLKSRLRWN